MGGKRGGGSDRRHFGRGRRHSQGLVPFRVDTAQLQRLYGLPGLPWGCPEEEAGGGGMEAGRS